MSHCGTNDFREITAFVKIHEQFAHQWLDHFTRRSLIYDLLLRLITDEHRAGSPITRVLVEIILEHHVMKATDEAVLILERRIIGKLKNKSHRCSVAA